MATKLYLTATRAGNRPRYGENSATLPIGIFNGVGGDNFQDLSLSATKGAAEVTKSLSTSGTTSHQDHYLGRFTSDDLVAQTITAQTWTIAIRSSETHGSSNAYLHVSLYIYRPTTQTVVGYIHDGTDILGAEWNGLGQVITFAGSEVTCQARDVLVLEVWKHAVQLSIYSYSVSIYFGGTTDVVDGTAADAASYISTPQDLVFAPAGSPAAVGTRFYLRTTVAANPPTNGEKSVALPVGTFKGNTGNGFENLSLSTTKGVAQTTKNIATIMQTTHQDNYICRFTSQALTARTIVAQTWRLAVGCSQGNAAATGWLVASVYIWRPSTGAVVGYIYDSDTPLGREWPDTRSFPLDVMVCDLPGAEVTIQDDDVLVLEIWRHAPNSANFTYPTNPVYFEGATDAWWNVHADVGAYLESEGDLFSTVARGRSFIVMAGL
jgi:hypothetical protein